MEFVDFARLVVEHLGVDDQGPWYPWTGIFDDLEVDSFQAFQLIMVVEAAAGLEVPDGELPPIYTLGDAYDYYRSARLQAAARP